MYYQTINQLSYYFWSKVSVWNVNCARATSFIFDTRTVVLVKVSKFLRQKMSHVECSNLLNYQGQTFAVPCFEYWLWQYRYSLSKVNIWNVNCARTTSFIFDTRMVVLVRPSNLRIHAECSILLSYQGHTFAVPCFDYWFWRYRYFWSKVNIWNVNCVRATAFIFDTRTVVLVKVLKFLRQKMSRPERDSNPQPSDSCRML